MNNTIMIGSAPTAYTTGAALYATRQTGETGNPTKADIPTDAAVVGAYRVSLSREGLDRSQARFEAGLENERRGLEQRLTREKNAKERELDAELRRFEHRQAAERTRFENSQRIERMRHSRQNLM
ncbi:hypothetical protein JCM14469_12630 [Desulfatiferula olefinivorans]